jgi:cytochrome c553
MKTCATLVVVALAFVSPVGTIAENEESPPPWAYAVNPPDWKPLPDDGSIRRVPDSTAGFTSTQLRDLFLAPDWHSGDHPPMPEVVARGRKPDVMACGVCHRADGPGGPENASLWGLPAAYIAQQMADLKSGARATSVLQRLPPKLMISTAKGATTAEVEAAAAYFASIKPRANIRVVETDTIPKSYVTGWHFAASTTGEKESLGRRIIEVPEDLERFVSRDTRSQFIAYVPTGSIEKGRVFAASGGAGKSVQCAVCHGADLKGLGPIPGIAGRSPTYLVRQLYDFKHGARAGTGAALMKPTVQNLTVEDMLVLAAYAASLAP